MRFDKPPLPAAILACIITITCSMNISAQDPPSPQNSPQVANDPIEQLRLLPEQRQKIRAIRDSNRQERAMINLRLREANIALNQALDADNSDDALIEQCIRDVAAAQAASMRLRIFTEVKIRRVLTPEQLATLRSLQSQVQGLNRDRNQNPRPVRQGDVLRPNQRNGIFPRRDGVPRPRP